jgi:hypothetical protein
VVDYIADVLFLAFGTSAYYYRWCCVLANKILFTNNYIEVRCDRNDVDTQTKLTSIYPVHVNRIRTSYRMSIHNTPEILKLLRNIDENNIGTAYKTTFIRRCGYVIMYQTY